MTQGPAIRNNPWDKSTPRSGILYKLFHHELPGACTRQSIFIRRADKRGKHRVRFQRLGFEFRMELAAEKPWMFRQLHNLHKIPVRRNPRNDQTVAGKNLFE